MLPTSMRWRLPLSYAMIALLATFALGVVLLTTLRGYYAQREYEHLDGNAQAISFAVSEMHRYNLSADKIQAQLQSLSFLAQSRIRLLSLNGETVIDSGDGQEPRTIALSYNERFSSQAPDILYYIDKPGLPSVSGVVFDDDSQVTWESSIDIGPAERAMTLSPDDPTFGQRFFMVVAATPLGFGLNSTREIIFERRSDQKAEAPLLDDTNNLIGYVQLSDGPAYGTEIVSGVGRALLGAGAIAVLLAAVVGWFISRQMSAPLLLLADATHRMADGNLSSRVSMHREDEFGRLANSFNHMATRVENTVTALRRFVADAAHELQTPITALHANLELAATDDDQNARLTFIQHAQEQLKRLEAMTNSLLDLSKLEAGELQDERTPVDMVSLVSQVSELYASRAEQAGLSFQFDTPEKPIVAHVNETQLRRVVGNLLDNAIKFTSENGVIRAGLRYEGQTIQLWVQDTGIGIPVEDLPHLFSRFRRARNASGYPGSGLGLAIIKTIVEGHGGQVSVESSSQGTRFLLYLPTKA
jgi:signal transduction histidine kinase